MHSRPCPAINPHSGGMSDPASHQRNSEEKGSVNTFMAHPQTRESMQTRCKLSKILSLNIFIPGDSLSTITCKPDESGRNVPTLPIPPLQMLILIKRKRIKGQIPSIQTFHISVSQNFPARRRKFNSRMTNPYTLKMMRPMRRVNHILIGARRISSLNTLGPRLTHKPGVKKGKGWQLGQNFQKWRTLQTCKHLHFYSPRKVDHHQ